MINGFKSIYIDNIFGLAFILSQVYYAIVFSYILNPFNFKNKKLYPRKICETLANFLVIFLLSCLFCGYYNRPYFQSVVTTFDLTSVTFSIILVIYNVIVYHRGFVKQAIIAMLFNSLFCVQSSLAGWFGTCQDYIWNLNTSFPLTLGFNILGMILLTVLMLKFDIQKFIYVPTVMLILVFGSFLFTFCSISIFRLNFLEYALYNAPASFFIIYLLLIVLSVFIYLMIYYNAKEYNEKRVEQLIIDANKGYIEMMQMSEDKYNSIRKINHDVKNQFMMLKLLAQEKKYDELEKYLNNYLSTMSEISLSSHCGNKVLDDVLTIIYSKCDKEKITLNSKVIVPQTFNIEPIDLCCVLTNLADNAIKSIKDEENREINLDIKYINQSLVIEMTNYSKTNFDERHLDSLVHEQSKSDYHGYGLKIINGIAEKYHGSLKLACQNHVFTADVLLFDEGNKNGKNN